MYSTLCPVVRCPYLCTSDMGTAGVGIHQENSSFEPFALMEAVRKESYQGRDPKRLKILSPLSIDVEFGNK